MNKNLKISILFLVLCSSSFAQQDLNKELKGTKTIEPKIKTKNMNDCPVKISIKQEGYEPVSYTYESHSKANLVRSSATMKFDLVDLNDIELKIPAFKQFKNNKTDFTEDGEKEFKEIIHKIKVFLQNDTQGKTVTLQITGSASQIPTSFDPSKPNDNLNADGSSIVGKTSIKNNRLLAKARADELAKKLHLVFPQLNIVSPKLEEIKLGATVWTYEHQKKLSKAIEQKNKGEIVQIFEPFQKDQWVKVESNHRATKTVQPEAMKMYMVSTTPSLKTKIGNQEQTVKTIFIVSKNTYDKVGASKTFTSVGDRDRFLKKMNLKIYHWDKDSVQRWYLLNIHEAKALQIAEYKERVIHFYKDGIADQLDEAVLKAHVIEELAKQFK
jgi:hypothetical protein